MSPSPRLVHQRIVTRLVLAIGPYCARHGVGEVLTSPADVSWGSDTLVQPDVLVVTSDEAGKRDWSKCGPRMRSSPPSSPRA